MLQSRPLSNPPVSSGRIAAAFAVAILADMVAVPITALLFTGIFAVPVELIDLMVDAGAAVAAILLLGFHWALLPGLVVEVVPVLGVLPTWTAAVAYVVWERRRQEAQANGASPRGERMVTADAVVPAPSTLDLALPASSRSRLAVSTGIEAPPTRKPRGSSPTHAVEVRYSDGSSLWFDVEAESTDAAREGMACKVGEGRVGRVRLKTLRGGAISTDDSISNEEVQP